MKIDPLIGRKVRYKDQIRTIVAVYSDIPGGVRLDSTIDGVFVSWNMDELELLEEELEKEENLG